MAWLRRNCELATGREGAELETDGGIADWTADEGCDEERFGTEVKTGVVTGVGIGMVSEGWIGAEVVDRAVDVFRDGLDETEEGLDRTGEGTADGTGDEVSKGLGWE